MDDKIILYTTHCPRCKGLELALKKNKILYEEIYINPNKAEEIQTLLNMGLQSAPGLKVGNKILNYPAALTWIKEQQ